MGVEVPWPISNNPGLKPQEGTGKLVNVFAEPRGDKTPVWRRVPGASVFARVPSVGSAVLSVDANARSAGQLFSTFFEIVGSTTTKWLNSTTTDAVEIAYPTGTTNGDLVFILAGADDTNQLPTTSAGFSQIATSVAWMHKSLMWKISTGETTASYVSRNSAVAEVALTYSIRGADQTNPIVDTATMTTGASGDPAPGSITCTTADCLIMTVAWVDDDMATTATAPTTCTVAAATTFGCGGTLFAASTGAANAAASVMVGFRPKPTTGAITFSTWSVDTDDEWSAQTFTLRHD